ncbi:MAG: hypothetical protein GY711_13070 [bacterium]|nr:hypothetical protein [bacterium]
MTDQTPSVGPELEATDQKRFVPGFDSGGIPWFLLVLYLAFLSLFTWYVLENQLPSFLEEGPGQSTEANE